MNITNEIRIDVAEEFPHLPKAPIVEAVIDIRARSEAAWEEPAVRSQAEEKLEGYAFLDSQRMIEHQVKMEMGKPPEQILRELGWRGLRFKSEDDRHICQFNRDGFVFSRLRPYEDWEQLQSE